MTTPTPARGPAPTRTRRAGPSRYRGTGERGQTTAEYALVLLGAAAVALLLVTWATDTDAIGRLLDVVLDSILDRV